MEAEHAGLIADHILDAELALRPAGGMMSVVTLAEHMKGRDWADEIKVERIGANSATVDGGGMTGYVTSIIAMDTAIDLARQSGIGIVGLHDSWWSGGLAHYLERAACEGLIAIHAASAKARVAPFGGSDPILGTNPLAFGFPADPDPLVIDIGTSAMTAGELRMRLRLGRPLDPGTAVDADGAETLDPGAVAAGAILPWGGPRGYAIALAIQVLGILAGGQPVAREVRESGFLFIVFNPELLMPLPEFKARVGELMATLETSRPADGSPGVRVPGRRAAATRRATRETGTIDVDDDIYAALMALTRG